MTLYIGLEVNMNKVVNKICSVVYSYKVRVSWDIYPPVTYFS